MKLNNRGYMIIEVLMASMIAFGIAYFLFDLTVNMKNKSDNVQKMAVIMADRGIIENYIMGKLKNATDISCSADSILQYTNGTETHLITIDDDDNCFVDYIRGNPSNHNYKKSANDYINFSSFSCADNGNNIIITIGIDDVLTTDNYNIELRY